MPASNRAKKAARIRLNGIAKVPLIFTLPLLLTLLLAACDLNRPVFPRPGGVTPLQAAPEAVSTQMPPTQTATTAAITEALEVTETVEPESFLEETERRTAQDTVQESTPAPSTTPPAPVTGTPAASNPANSAATNAPTRPATLVAAAPSDDATYRMRPWVEEEADTLIARLEQFPEQLALAERGYGDAAYYAAFRYAALAQHEALLRFPNSNRVERWRWGLAYNYVRTGDERALPYYALLLQEALDEGQLAPGAAGRWLAEREPRLAVTSLNLEAPSGYSSGVLLVLETGEDESGGFLWLLQNELGTAVHALPGTRFDLPYGAGFSYDTADVTGDGVDELVTVQGHQPGNEPSFYYTDILVYDLSQETPHLLPFEPKPATHLGWGERDNWSVVHSAQTGIHLRLRGLVSPQCDAVELVNDYIWDGTLLRLDSSGYQFRPEAPGNVRFCLPFIYSAAEAGNRDALAFLQAIASEAVAEQDGAADEWRYRLALYRALAADFVGARAYLDDLIANPVDNGSEWVLEAIRFADFYRTPQDLYRACANAELCNERLALERHVASLSAADFGVATEALESWGVPLNRSGFFDLDGDGRQEQWLLVNQNDSEMVLWFLQRGFVTEDERMVEVVRALYAGVLNRDDSVFTLDRLTAVAQRPVIRAATRTGQLLFSVEEGPEGLPVLNPLRRGSDNESSNFTAQFLSENMSGLLPDPPGLGRNPNAPPLPPTAAPEEILQRLQAFRDSSSFNCSDASSTLCADYDFAICLALEMAGDAPRAANAYRRLWQDYPQSALALIARSKLEIGD